MTELLYKKSRRARHLAYINEIFVCFNPTEALTTT
jgi:hypothetical protein